MDPERENYMFGGFLFFEADRPKFFGSSNLNVF